MFLAIGCSSVATGGGGGGGGCFDFTIEVINGTNLVFENIGLTSGELLLNDRRAVGFVRS